MRKFLILGVLLLAIGSATGARAQSFVNGLPAVQGQNGSVSVVLPDDLALEGWNLSIAYSSLVFEDLTASSFSSPYPFRFYGNPTPGEEGNVGGAVDLTDLGDFPNISVHPGSEYRQITVVIVFDTDLQPGENLPVAFVGGTTLVNVAFGALANAEVGPADVFFHGNYFDLASEHELSATLSTNIAAVPEPETWAMMFAGLVLVGGAVARSRRGTRS
jgi:hypothetical protein